MPANANSLLAVGEKRSAFAAIGTTLGSALPPRPAPVTVVESQ